MRRLVIVSLFSLLSMVLLVFHPRQNAGNAALYRFAGSTLGVQESGSSTGSSRESGSNLYLRGSDTESGSTTSSYQSRWRGPETGSSVRYPRSKSESGSAMRRFRPRRESGSMLRESGSRMGYQDTIRKSTSRESGSAIALPPRNNAPHGKGKYDRPPESFYSGKDRIANNDLTFSNYAEKPIPPVENQLQDVSLLLIALLIFLTGFGLAWILFRGGAVVPPISAGRTLWEKQVELCCNLIQQMDAVILEVQAQDWDKCGDSLEALKSLNGQRTVLLNNEINRAAIVFLASANYCIQRKDCSSHFADMKACYHASIDSIRIIANSEPMSPEIHQLLDASHQQLRAIRLKESGAA